MDIILYGVKLYKGFYIVVPLDAEMIAHSLIFHDYKKMFRDKKDAVNYCNIENNAN